MHAGLHIPACVLNQTFNPLGIPRRFRPVEIRSKFRLCSIDCCGFKAVLLNGVGYSDKLLVMQQPHSAFD